MSSLRPGTAGATRSCPHCKATILESSSVCPACKGHLRFEPGAAQRESSTPLRVDGTIRQPATGGPAEYSVLLSIRNERGEEITRQVLGVGALRPDEERTFTLSVEMFAAADTRMKAKTGR